MVYVYVDDVTGRCVATNKLKSFVNNETLTVRPREEVDLLVASESEIGYRVVIDNRHWGMLYRNQLFRPVQVGDRLRGYVTKITDDPPHRRVAPTAGLCRRAGRCRPAARHVARSGRRLPLGDDSSPEEIHRRTQLSKKAFKRSLGVLLKRGVVAADEEGIKLTKQ